MFVTDVYLCLPGIGFMWACLCGHWVLQLNKKRPSGTHLSRGLLGKLWGHQIALAGNRGVSFFGLETCEMARFLLVSLLTPPIWVGPTFSYSEERCAACTCATVAPGQAAAVTRLTRARSRNTIFCSPKRWMMPFSFVV